MPKRKGPDSRRWPAPATFRAGLADSQRRLARYSSAVGDRLREAGALAEAARIEAGGAVLIKAGTVDRAYWAPGVCLDTTFRLDEDDHLSVVDRGTKW